MNIPANLKYTKDHEWVKIEGDIATVGVTAGRRTRLCAMCWAGTTATCALAGTAAGTVTFPV